MVNERETDWLIEEAEQEIVQIAKELKRHRISLEERNKLRLIFATLMGTLQKLYVQRSLTQPTKDTVDLAIDRVPDKEAKKVLKELLRLVG